MSVKALIRLVGEAVCNHRFREGLLNGHREEFVGLFDLTPEERAFILDIRAGGLEDFAHTLDQWLYEREYGDFVGYRSVPVVNKDCGQVVPPALNGVSLHQPLSAADPC